MNINEMRRLAEHLISPYVCETCGMRFTEHPLLAHAWHRGCPACASKGIRSRVSVPYAGGDTSQRQVDQEKFRQLVTPNAMIAMLDVIEEAQLWRQCHSPQGISELGLAKALENLEKMK